MTPLAALVVAAAAVATDPVDDYVRTQMARRKIPGLALAVVQRVAGSSRISARQFCNVATKTLLGSHENSRALRATTSNA